MIKCSTVNRKRLFGAGMAVMLFLLMAGLASLQPAAAQSVGGFEGAIYDIVPDAPTLSSLPAVGNTFFLTGKIYPFRTFNPATCQPPAGADLDSLRVGTWRAWGEVGDGGRLVIHQSLTLDKLNGSIEAQGTTGSTLAEGAAAPAVLGTTSAPFTGPSETVPLTGGAGTFRGISGEANVRPYCQSQEETARPFRYDRAFCFGVVETPRRRLR